jgi:CheY-like chemotaxis protein
MKKELIIVLVENDFSHALLVEKSLRYIGVDNEILHFKNSNEILNFLFRRENGLHRQKNTPYIIIIDVTEVGSFEAIKQIKQDDRLRLIPTFVITNIDDSSDVEIYYDLGCNFCVTKPVDYDSFIEIINCIGLLINIIEVPIVNNEI